MPPMPNLTISLWDVLRSYRSHAWTPPPAEPTVTASVTLRLPADAAEWGEIRQWVQREWPGLVPAIDDLHERTAE